MFGASTMHVAHVIAQRQLVSTQVTLGIPQSWCCSALSLCKLLYSVQLAKRISPSMEIGPLSAPSLLVPVMALAQVVNVSRPGEEPDPAGNVPEDVRLHDSFFSDPEGARALIA